MSVELEGERLPASAVRLDTPAQPPLIAYLPIESDSVSIDTRLRERRSKLMVLTFNDDQLIGTNSHT